MKGGLGDKMEKGGTAYVFLSASTLFVYLYFFNLSFFSCLLCTLTVVCFCLEKMHMRCN